jgi:hypothetical protein
MMDAAKVKLTRDYAINLDGGYGYYQHSDDGRLKATLSIAMLNKDDAGLGKPLPMGSVRVYEPAKEGAPVFIGAAQVGNTPKDDRIDLTLTEVFNVYARSKTIETKKIDKHHTQTKYEVTVFNEKEGDLDVRLVKNVYGTWSITDETTKSTRPTASMAQWVLHVPAGESKTLTYTLVTNY